MIQPLFDQTQLNLEQNQTTILQAKIEAQKSAFAHNVPTPLNHVFD